VSDRDWMKVEFYAAPKSGEAFTRETLLELTNRLMKALDTELVDELTITRKDAA